MGPETKEQSLATEERATDEPFSFRTAPMVRNPQVERVSELFEKLTGVRLGDPLREALRIKDPFEIRTLLKLERSLEKALNREVPFLRRGELAQALEVDWLPNKISLNQIQRRTSIALITGYLLIDDPVFEQRHGQLARWSNRDLERIQKVLEGLPDSLKNLTTLKYVRRQAIAEHFIKFTEDMGDYVQRAGFFANSWASLQWIKGNVLLQVGVGGSFGSAYLQSGEIRLYNELFKGSSILGFGPLPAYTTLHEIFHHKLWSDREACERFKKFYDVLGQREAPYQYAASSIDEGFAVGSSVFAVSPDLLKSRSPTTFQFMKDEYGDSLRHYNGGVIPAAVIHLVYSAGDLFHGR